MNCIYSFYTDLGKTPSSIDYSALVLAPLTHSSPAKMSTSSRTRVSRHTPLSRSLSPPPFLRLVLTLVLPLQLSPPRHQRHRKLDHRMFHIVPPVTILMTPVRTDRTPKEQRPDGKMTDSPPQRSAHPRRPTHDPKPRTIWNISPPPPCTWHTPHASPSQTGFSNAWRPRASGTFGTRCK